MESGKMYVGLDIGTNSVGYAVTNDRYDLKKYHGEPAWGSVVFDEGALADVRRAYRTARRRLDRKKQRVQFIQEFFAKEINAVDPGFYKRIKESTLYRDDVDCAYTLFCDIDYSDADYHREYPTIHHLIVDLMKNPASHDVRLVYLAVSWLVAHRGHFLSNISLDNIESVKDFKSVYNAFMDFFTEEKPWDKDYNANIGNIIKKKIGVNKKYLELKEYLYSDTKPSKEVTESFPYSREGILKLLSGGSYKLKDLYGKDEYDEFGSISLGVDDDKLMEISSEIGDDFELIRVMRSVYDWATLVDVLGSYETISEAKVEIYNEHSNDLKMLKHLIKTYRKEKYDEVFRDDNGGKYGSYVKGGKGSINLEIFSKYLLGILSDVEPNGEDSEILETLKSRLELQLGFPKQKNTDNRVIPYQLYLYELIKVLDNAGKYLTFLEASQDGLTVKEKIVSVFKFRIPYFVGPLNSHSDYAWIKRYPGAEGRIFPWNFEEKVDLDASEQEFIRRMTNVCTYLPGEDVLPKCSLLYQKFVVLNEINNISINGERISVDLKQDIFNNLFMKSNKVSKKRIVDYLIANGNLEKGNEEALSGIDVNLNGTLSSSRAFSNLIKSGKLSEQDVEMIIERSTYSEEKSRLMNWIGKNYPHLTDEDVKYICSIKLKDFGRLSARFLNGIEGCDKSTGEVYTVISALWNTGYNLSELVLSDEHFTFKNEVEEYQRTYYSSYNKKLSDRLDDMYISNAVRRPIYRTISILNDVEKAFGKPDKIFIEMARGADEKQKGKRKDSRLDQIINLYKECRDVDVKELKKQLEDMGEYANNKLQSDKLFLYYMQLGKCMYTGKPIRLEELGTKLYDIDHIYPQAYVTDDSIINNKVLVLSEENGKKSDTYPIASEIRHKMASFWKHLYDVKLISETKYKRLIRSTPFSDEEKQGFISRQYVETTQATKAVAAIIKEKYPETEIVYCKARLVSDFRHEFEIHKSRRFNDLHHAVDAYLNIVTGNVYNMRFTKKWFSLDQKYSVNPKTIFTHEVKCGDMIVWDKDMLEKVKRQAVRNNAHFVKYSYFKHGGLFDQMPVAKSAGLIPRKKGLPTEKYGGYNKSSAMFYIPVRYKQGKKSTVIIMSVEMLYGKRFLEDMDFAKEYSFERLEHILGKPVDEVEFPMGMRPWKVNTVLSLDGFRVCITGIGGGGKCLVAQGIMQFASDKKWTYYLKKLEKYSEKKKNNKNYIYDESYDKITPECNIELYDLYIQKYKESIYSKRINKPLDILLKGREKFAGLEVDAQVDVLLNIQETFGRNSSGGVDLSRIGGSKNSAATVNFSSTISNWAKTYKDVRIIDISPSGIWEKQSQNLLDLI